MVSIEVKQISSLCKTRMRVTVSMYEKYANHCLRINIHGNGLCMHIVKTFEHGNIQLPWALYTHA